MSEEVNPPVVTEDVARDIYFSCKRKIKDMRGIIANCRAAIDALIAAKFATSSREMRADLDRWSRKEEAFMQAANAIQDAISPFAGFFEESTESKEEKK